MHASTIAFASFRIGLLDPHVGIAKIYFNDGSFVVLGINFEFLDITLHGFVKCDCPALIFSFGKCLWPLHPAKRFKECVPIIGVLSFGQDVDEVADVGHASIYLIARNIRTTLKRVWWDV